MAWGSPKRGRKATAVQVADRRRQGLEQVHAPAPGDRRGEQYPEPVGEPAYERLGARRDARP
jgi:hypothetical protein